MNCARPSSSQAAAPGPSKPLPGPRRDCQRPPPPPPSSSQALLPIELSSGSDNDDDRAARLVQTQQARLAKRFEDRNLVRAAIPDVDPLVILERFKDPTYAGDPDLIAVAILESNYRLRDGGWKWGYDPEVGPGPSGDAGASGSGSRHQEEEEGDNVGRRAGNGDEADSDDEDAPSAPRADAYPRRLSDVSKRKRARRQSSDEEEEVEEGADGEVDQLASDDDDYGDKAQPSDARDEQELTYDDVMDQEGYWLEVAKRDPPEESYRKAAYVAPPPPSSLVGPRQC